MIKTKHGKQHISLILACVLTAGLWLSGCGEEPSETVLSTAEETETQDEKQKMAGEDETEGPSVETFIAPTEPKETTEAESTEIPIWKESENKGDTALAKCYSFVNVRTGPSTAYNIVGKVYNNCAATILDEINMPDGLWYLVTSGNCSGFIKAEYFIVGEAADAQKAVVGKTIGTVKEDYLRIRSTPDLTRDDNIIDRYRINTEVIITEVTDDGWAKISPDDTTVGYVYASCLDIRVEFGKAVTLAEEAEEEARNAALVEAFRKAKEEYERKLAAQRAAELKAKQDAEEKARLAAQSKNSLRQAVVAYALQFVGRPYVHAGRSLITGTDCSGFTSLVYQQFGYKLSYAPEYQWKQGTQVEMNLSKMLPGDLIFFTSTTKAVGHVGIYLGNGKLIHAANEQLGVIISDAFYRQPVCVVRIIQ